MRTACLFAAISMALSVSAASLQDNRGFGGFGKNGNNGNNGNNGSKSGASNSTLAAAANSTTSTATATASNSTSTSAASGSASNSTSAASGSASNSSDAQSSTTLNPAVIATGFESNGQETPTAGQVASLTSSNNFINFCLTVPNLPITNGKQIATGSCNPAPMGVIPSSSNMPSAKFTFPTNGDTSINENTAFTITMAVNNFATGFFVNADENYFAAPQQTNAGGQIIGHSHVVVEALSALDQTTPTNPQNFVFFKGLNDPAAAGILSADVTAGLPAGFYKLSSINTAANHQPVLVPIAQHGSLDDAVYFTVNGAGGAAATNGTASAGAASASGAPPAASVSAASAPPVASASATSAPPAASVSAASAPPVASASATSAPPAASAPPASNAPGSGSKSSQGNKGKRFYSRALQ